MEQSQWQVAVDPLTPSAPRPLAHAVFWFVAAALARDTLTFALGGLAIRLVAGDEQLAQSLEIAPQDAQGYVTLVAAHAAVPATLLAVAGLERAERRFHARMILSCLAKCHGPRLVLVTPLMLSFGGDAGRTNNVRQVFLILRCMKTPVE